MSEFKCGTWYPIGTIPGSFIIGYNHEGVPFEVKSPTNCTPLPEPQEEVTG